MILVDSTNFPLWKARDIGYLRIKWGGAAPDIKKATGFARGIRLLLPPRWGKAGMGVIMP
jgi:hypothetical protein